MLLLFAGASVQVAPISADKRATSAWVGGSILASLSTFDSLWISREEYDAGDLRDLYL